MVFVEQTFRCDYGFNIHFHGMALVNYNCVMLDTSPVNFGAGYLLHREFALVVLVMPSIHNSV
tara:strand:+ start:542 stop:730 length:189 start_codon:yes stop_codon:yes gene_type:complete